MAQSLGLEKYEMSRQVALLAKEELIDRSDVRNPILTPKGADFFGIATGNKMPDKFEKSSYHAVKSAHVNAPVVTEFPVALECELAESVQTDNLHAVVGKIVNVSAEESVISENGKIDPIKLNALIFDQFQSGYYVAGEKVGQAWNTGSAMMKAAQWK